MGPVQSLIRAFFLLLFNTGLFRPPADKPKAQSIWKTHSRVTFALARIWQGLDVSKAYDQELLNRCPSLAHSQHYAFRD